MKKIIKSVVCLFVSLIFILSAVACKGPMTDDEAKEIMKDLLVKETSLTAYVYGDAFELADKSEYDAHKDDGTFYYAKVSKDSPYTTKKELSDALSAVYTDSVMEEINVFAFSGSNETEGYTVIPRFYQSPKEDRLSIDVTSYGIYDLKSVIIIDTLTVNRSTASMMEVTVSYRPDVDKDPREMKIKAIKVDGTWKLDTRTWAVGVE